MLISHSALVCTEQNSLICPLKYALSDSHMIDEDIAGVWLILRKDFILVEMKFTKFSSERRVGLNLQGQ